LSGAPGLGAKHAHPDSRRIGHRRGTKIPRVALPVRVRYPTSAWALLASLTSTCRRHDVDPQLYLTQLLITLPALRTRDLPAWLPDQWKQNQTAKPDHPPK
jgi:hypothetical protein